jgi:hypothetical protein
MRRLRPPKEEEKPSHNQNTEVLYTSMKNSIDATVKNSIKAQ